MLELSWVRDLILATLAETIRRADKIFGNEVSEHAFVILSENGVRTDVSIRLEDRCRVLPLARIYSIKGPGLERSRFHPSVRWFISCQLPCFINSCAHELFMSMWLLHLGFLVRIYIPLMYNWSAGHFGVIMFQYFDTWTYTVHSKIVIIISA